MLERLAKFFSFASRRSELPDQIDIKFVPVTTMDTAFQNLGVPKAKSEMNFADAASNLLWVYVAVSKIVNTASMLPLKMYSTSVNSRGNGEKVEIKSGIQWELFNKPSLWMTPVEFRQCLFGNFSYSGNSYVHIDLVEKQLWPLKSQEMAIIADGTKFIRSYVYKPNGERPQYMDPATILHVKSFNPMSYFYGLSPLQAAWSQVSYLDNDEKFWQTFWKEGGRLYGIFTSDGPLTDTSIERLKTALKQNYGGVKKMQANIVLDNGMTFQQIGVSQKDAQLLEKAQATKEEILAAFGIPQALANIMDDANYSNMEVQERLFYQGAIQPMLALFEEALSSHPVLSAEGRIRYEFDLSKIDALKQSDTQKAELGKILLESGAWTQNEVRELWGKDPLADGNVLKPLTNQVGNPFQLAYRNDPEVIDTYVEDHPEILLLKEIDDVDREIATMEAAMPEIHEARKPKKPRYTLEFRDIERKAYDDQLAEEDNALAKSVAKIFRKQKEIVLGNLKKHLKKFGSKVRKDNEDDILKGLEGGKDDLISALSEAQSRTINRFGRRTKDQIDKALPEDSTYEARFNFSDPRVSKFITQRSTKFGGEINDETIRMAREEIAFLFAEGDDVASVAEGVANFFDGMEGWRAMRIARTETAAGAQEAIEVTYQTNGDVVKGREWVTSNDDRVRDSHQIDGQVVELDERFILGSGVEIEYPLAPSGPAEEVINCRCTTVPVLDFEEV